MEISVPVHKSAEGCTGQRQIPPDPLPSANVSSIESFSAAVRAAENADRCLVPILLDQPGAHEAELMAVLSEGEKRRAARLRRLRDRRHYIVARARLRQLLAERLEVRPEQVLLGCNAYGKPGLRDRHAESGWHFNLSYSDGAGGGLALCALCRWRRIGVDVESVRPLDRLGSTARHFFSPREYEAYRGLDPDSRLLAFFLCWTRKEAFAKALGKGLAFDLAAFDVSLDPGEPARLLSVGGMPGEWCGWHLESIGPAGGRVAAVVIEQKAK